MSVTVRQFAQIQFSAHMAQSLVAITADAEIAAGARYATILAANSADHAFAAQTHKLAEVVVIQISQLQTRATVIAKLQEEVHLHDTKKHITRNIRTRRNHVATDTATRAYTNSC